MEGEIVQALRVHRSVRGKARRGKWRRCVRQFKCQIFRRAGIYGYSRAAHACTSRLSICSGGSAAARGANHGRLDGLAKELAASQPEVVNLLQTFATQSALAIQNARLFREIEDKSRQIEAANRHKSEFLANMSHELRTPLNAIIGFSEVLGERLFGELNEKQAEYTDDILSSGRHLFSLINEILDLSKVEAGRMELELATFDLPLAIDNARTFVRERATKHGINLDVTH